MSETRKEHSAAEPLKAAIERAKYALERAWWAVEQDKPTDVGSELCEADMALSQAQRFASKFDEEDGP